MLYDWWIIKDGGKGPGIRSMEQTGRVGGGEEMRRKEFGGDLLRRRAIRVKWG